MSVVVVRRYIDILIVIITFPYSTCISSFFDSIIFISLFIFKMFFYFCLCYFCVMLLLRIVKDYRHKSLLLLNKNIFT